jgi:ribonuclease HII
MELMARFILGVDEVGRGALAGPVCSVCLALPVGCVPPQGINDSKKLSKKERERLAALLMNEYTYAIGFVSPQNIDKINILQATLWSMKLAVERLQIDRSHVEMVIIDGNQKPSLSYPTQTLVKGDQQEPSIMMASIIAKVIRDNYMQRMMYYYPQYDFGKHVGYPTKKHKEELISFGYSPLHRLSFKIKSPSSSLSVKQH